MGCAVPVAERLAWGMGLCPGHMRGPWQQRGFPLVRIYGGFVRERQGREMRLANWQEPWAWVQGQDRIPRSWDGDNEKISCRAKLLVLLFLQVQAGEQAKPQHRSAPRPRPMLSLAFRHRSRSRRGNEAYRESNLMANLCASEKAN